MCYFVRANNVLVDFIKRGNQIDIEARNRIVRRDPRQALRPRRRHLVGQRRAGVCPRQLVQLDPQPAGLLVRWRAKERTDRADQRLDIGLG